MEIGRVVPPGQLAFKPDGQSAPAWQPGTLLQAQVTARLSADLVTLQVGSTTVRAQTDLALEPGQTLKLRVLQGGNAPVLQRVSAPVEDHSVRTQAFRELLPRQEDFVAMLSGLVHINEEQHATLKPAVANALQALLTQVEVMSELSDPQHLQAALENSGLFLEAHLAALVRTRSTGVIRDLKAHLLRLNDALDHEQSLPPEQQTGATAAKLMHIVTAALAKLELNQLQSATESLQQGAVWKFDLPLRDEQALQPCHIRIAEEPSDSTSASGRYRKHWSLTLSFALDRLGPIHARLDLVGDALNTTLWAEDSRTYTAISAALHSLREEFIRAEIKPAELQCFQGRPRTTATDTLPQELIDTRV